MISKRALLHAGLLYLAILRLFALDVYAADQHELIAKIDQASQQFRPISAAVVARAKQDVRNSLLDVGAAVGRAQDWRNYLLWDDQFREFDRADITPTDVWRRVLHRVARDAEMFEADAFQRYRSALRKLIDGLQAYGNPALEADYQAVLAELKQMLPANEERLQAASVARISELLTTLNRQRQAPELIAAIRHYASQPNLIIEIPAETLASERPLKEDYTFRQIVRGSPVQGSGTLHADQAIALGASADTIALDTFIRGHSNSSSLGFGDGVTVRSSGFLQFQAESKVLVNLKGVTASDFDTTGSLATRILSVSTNYRGRAAERARQTVYNRQEADRRAAQSRALHDLDVTFNSRLESLIAPLRAAYQRDFYLPLARHDRLPQQSHFSSDGGRAIVNMWLADDAQLAAPGAPPWSGENNKQLRLAVHESAINNTSALLEGRVRSLVSILNGAIFEYIAETAKPSERIDIRFHDETAVRVTLRDGRIELRLVGAEYIIDGSTYPAMEIVLRYHLESGGSPALHLSEPPQVVASAAADGDRPRVGLRGIALRRILSNALEKNATETVDLAEITLPEPFDQLGKFRTQQVNIVDGWFFVEATPIRADPEEAAGTPIATGS